MNAFFELLHGGHSAFAVFLIDVAVFIILAVVVYALGFLIKHEVSKFLSNLGPGKFGPRCLGRGKSKKTF